MSGNTYQIRGMHCASCASIIERKLQKQAGVKSVAVSYGTEKAQLDFDSQITDLTKLSAVIKPLGYTFEESGTDQMSMPGHDHSKMLKQQELGSLRHKVQIAMPLVIISALFMVWDLSSGIKLIPEMPFALTSLLMWLMPLLAAYSLFFIGRQYLRGVWIFIRRGAANMDTLVGIGTLAAFLYSFVVSVFGQSLRNYINIEHTYYDVTIIVIGLITLGKYLEARAKLKTGEAIKKLMGLQVKTALIVRNGKEQEIFIDQVQHGDLILVKPGMKVPVDGIITDGHSNINESMLTGEPMPVSKNVGDKVAAGTINTTGSFTLKATNVGSETLLAHIIKMVEDAQGSKAPIQKLADKIAAIFVPAVLIISFLSVASWLLIGSRYMVFSEALSFGLTSFVGVLIIACPCALGLATPTAIIVGVGKGASNGILIKNAEVLEKLHKVTTLVIDKTGTLTVGRPELISLKTLAQLDSDKALQILASLEKNSEHPLGECIVQNAISKKINLLKTTDFKNLPGQGISGKVEGQNYYVGGPALLAKFKLAGSDDRNNQTIVYLTTEKQLLAQVNIGDKLKPEAKAAIDNLHQSGTRVIMATGDNQRAAQNIADQLGIDEVLAQTMPADKLAKIKALQSQGQVVAMAGDGVNDAPALAQADVGLTMSTGTDVSIETSDVTLLNGDISKIAQAIKLSRLTMATVKQNLFWAFIYNIIGIPIASGLFYPIFGWVLSPVLAGLAMALSSVSVVSNSLRLKTKKL
ncbi:MAG: heavy metal translocating P-type ATPase [Parcubacteria group bacterium]|nr:MAG: heavy metal translocating P-type ATPase [Parcubacteria group bacterium]